MAAASTAIFSPPASPTSPPRKYSSIVNKFPLAAGASTQPSLPQIELQESEFSVEDLLNAAEASTQPSPTQWPPLDSDFFEFADATNQPLLQKVFIRMPAPFEVIQIETTDDETVLQLKLSIQEILKISADQIVIKDQCSVELPDHLKLLQCKFSDKLELNVEFSAKESFHPDIDCFSVDELKNFITLKIPELPFNGAANFEAADYEAIVQLILSIQEISRIPVKVQYGNELLDAMMLQSQPPPPTSSQPAPPPMPRPMLPLYEGRMMRVVLQHLDARVPVEVAAAGKVSQLRSMHDENKVAMNIDLPDPYYFIYNQVGIDENCNFFSQNIAEGGIIEIVELKSNKPNQKARFYVLTHSDETILELKQKISSEEGIPVDRILIKKNGIEQPDHKTLHACSITSDSGITVDILKKKKKKM